MKSFLLKTILITAIGFSNSFFSQQVRFYYQLSYKACDTCEETSEELNVLSVGQNKSIFQSYDQLQKDSIFIVAEENQKKYGAQIDIDKVMAKRINHSFIIIKNYQSKEIFYKDILGDQSSVQYEEKEKINWKLSPVKDTVSNYLSQKATAEFGGRIWEAWFTADLPIQDGPYKFWGLPGLIVKIEDQKKEYSWKLIGNKKIKSENLYEDNIMDYQRFPMTQSTKENFLKLKKQYEKNPLGDLLLHIGEVDGDVIKQLKEQEKSLLRYYQNHNNSIEIE